MSEANNSKSHTLQYTICNFSMWTICIMNMSHHNNGLIVLKPFFTALCFFLIDRPCCARPKLRQMWTRTIAAPFIRKQGSDTLHGHTRTRKNVWHRPRITDVITDPPHLPWCHATEGTTPSKASPSSLEVPKTIEKVCRVSPERTLDWVEKDIRGPSRL